MSSQPQAGGRGVAASPSGRRAVLLSTDSYFTRRSPAFATAVGVLLIVAISTIDVFTGRLISLTLFYLLPVAVVTWRLGRLGGVAIAGATALAWTISDLVVHAYAADTLPAFWNALARFAVLDVVATLLAALHDRMRAERELAQAAVDSAQQLKGLNELKDTLLHAVSHDLRGPITAIVGSAQILERGRGLDLTQGDQDVLIDGILQSGRKLNRVVSDLLDLERLDRGLIEPDRAPTDIGALVDRVVGEAIYADEHSIHVETREPVELRVDAGKIERVVENLLVNAVKHTPPGTPIDVRVERGRAGVVLSVEDRGPGVPDDIKGVIFQPFRQGDGARSGVGIGLSLVSRFAELHGGRAWVEDRAGGGAAFRVFLPADERPETASEAAVPVAG